MSDSILDIQDILNDYSLDIQEALQNEAEKVAKEGAADLKANSPHRTGKYAKGWRVKTIKGKGFVECTIYNSTSYQLTHLLENGHLTRNGKKVPAIKHIEPVEQKCIKEYQKNVENIIKNGG